jgi:general secretion pathway protein G
MSGIEPPRGCDTVAVRHPAAPRGRPVAAQGAAQRSPGFACSTMASPERAALHGFSRRRNASASFTDIHGDAGRGFWLRDVWVAPSGLVIGWDGYPGRAPWALTGCPFGAGWAGKSAAPRGCSVAAQGTAQRSPGFPCSTMTSPERAARHGLSRRRHASVAFGDIHGDAGRGFCLREDWVALSGLMIGWDGYPGRAPWALTGRPFGAGRAEVRTNGKVLCVIVALFVLLLGLTAAVADVAPVLGARANLVQLSGMLEQFRSEYGRYPTQAEGLAALVEKPKNLTDVHWKSFIRELPKDPWGGDCVYVYPGVHHPDKYDLYYLGQDGISKTGGEDPDDIDCWNLKKAVDYYLPAWLEARRPEAQALFDFQFATVCLVGFCVGIVLIFIARRLFRNKVYLGTK